MLIHLDRSLCDIGDGFASEELDSFRNLAIAASEGNHYLVAPRALATFLSRHSDLGRKERSVYRMIDDRYSSMAGLATDIPLKIRVLRNCARSIGRVGSQSEITLPLNFFSLSASIQPSILLCENSDDCDLILEMARLYVRSKSIGNVKVVFENKSGGGSGCASEAESLLERRRRLFLTIVDSDRICPGGAIGCTAASVKSVYDRFVPAESSLIILDVRELENLIPDDFYREHIECIADHRHSARFICSLAEAGCDLARRFIDVKEGLLLGDVLDLSDRPPDFKSVWWPVVESIRERKIVANSKSIACASDEVCAKRGACECILMGPNRMALLSRCTELSRRNLREFWRYLPDSLRVIIENLGQEAFCWGCGGSFLANI